MIALLVRCAVYGICCYLAFWLMTYLKVPEPVCKVVTVLLVLIAVIWLLTNFLPAANSGLRFH